MAWDKTLTYNHDSESTRELHVLNAYADPEFIKDIERVAGRDGSKLFADFFGRNTNANLRSKKPSSIEAIAAKLSTSDFFGHIANDFLFF
jgi:hypothetical protein